MSRRRVALAREVRHRRDHGLTTNPRHEVGGLGAGAATGAVGDADEARTQRFQLGDGPPEAEPTRLVLRREELERVRRARRRGDRRSWPYAPACQVIAGNRLPICTKSQGRIHDTASRLVQRSVRSIPAALLGWHRVDRTRLDRGDAGDRPDGRRRRSSRSSRRQCTRPSTATVRIGRELGQPQRLPRLTRARRARPSRAATLASRSPAAAVHWWPLGIVAAIVGDNGSRRQWHRGRRCSSCSSRCRSAWQRWVQPT